jgi:hypothetical protein
MKLPTKKKLPTPKTALLPLLKDLKAKHLAVRKFQSKHERVFTELHELTEARDVAENVLKTESKRLGAGFTSEETGVVEYVMPMHKYFSPEVLEDEVDDKILDALGVIERKKIVNEKILKSLVKLGKIKKSVMQKAFRSEPTGSPRVTITINEEE